MELRSYGQGSKSITIQGNVPGAVLDASFMGEGLWYISRVFVSPKNRGKGLGRKLLQMLVAEVSSHPDARVIEVYPGGYDFPRAQAFKFYKSCGFTVDPKCEFRLVYFIPETQIPAV